MLLRRLTPPPGPHSMSADTANTEREMLEMAAKAAGYGPGMQTFGKGLLVQSGTGPDQIGVTFDPLNDDGDALRLAVKLRISVTMSEYRRVVCRAAEWTRSIEPYGDDPAAATRLAIVRAAASIGSSMQKESGNG